MAVLAIRAAALEAGEIEASSALPAHRAAPSAGREEHPADLEVRQVQQADSDPAQAQRVKGVHSAPEAAVSVALHEAAQGVPSAEFVPLEAAAHLAEVTQAEAEEVPAAAVHSAAVEEGSFNAG